MITETNTKDNNQEDQVLANLKGEDDKHEDHTFANLKGEEDKPDDNVLVPSG